MRVTRVVLSLALVLAPYPAHAQDMAVCGQNPDQLRSGDHEQITVSSTAIGFTAGKLTPTNGAPKPVCAIVQVITNSVSYWGNYAAPTASDGLVISTNGSVIVGRNDLVSFRMIRVTSDATVSVQYLAPVSP